jgi:alkylation response protein AidB-like acyl-CoA dehydrogenase
MVDVTDPLTVDAFRQQTRTFLAAALVEGVACPAFGAILPPALLAPAVEWQRYCFDHGFAGIHWPTEHGGRGLTREHSVVWYEECARAAVAPYVNLQGIVLAGEAVLRSGTDAQRQRFLRPTISAEIVWCQLFSEPGAGSDLAGLQTTAELDGDRYVVNGQKVWTSNGDLAQFGILMARTDRELPKHKGISFFLLDMSLPGVEVRPLRQMTGDSEFCEVFLTDVPMPADALLGPINGGWGVAMEVLQDERGSVGQAAVIDLDRRLDGLRRLAAADDRVARDQVARLLARGGALRALMLRRSGEAAVAPVTKVARSELDFSAVLVETALVGAAAMLSSDMTDRLLYSPGMRIAGGTSEIQRNIIGDRVLGLPREPSG